MRPRGFALFALASLGLAAIVVPAELQAADSESRARMHRVETQLIPSAPADGKPLKAVLLLKRMAELHVPGISVAVVHDGKIDWTKGYGMAWAGGPGVTTETLFQAASISKPISALAVLHLVEAGQISLDHKANDYLRDWKIPESPLTATSKVTVAELLNHTAGINLSGFPGYGSTEPIPTLEQILRGESPAYGPAVALSSVPGSQFRYSGGGYLILRKLLTDVTGQPFEKLMRTQVLLPLGMTHSTFQQPLPTQLIPRATLPHDAEGHVFRNGARIYPEEAPDGLWTTASDIADYILAMQKSLKGGGFLSKDMAQRMVTPGKEHWGLGPIIGKDPKHPYFMFSGGNAGFISVFVAYESGDGVAVLTNGERGDTLGSEIVRTVAKVYGWPDFQPVQHHAIDLPPESLNGIEGLYRDSSGSTQAITRTKDALFFTRIGGRNGPQRIYASSKDHFSFETTAEQNFPETGEVEVTFGRGPNGIGRSLREVMDGSNVLFHGTRLSTAEAQPVLRRLREIALRYDKQVPAPGGPEDLRHLLTDLIRGKPEDTRVGAELAEVLRTDRTPNARLFSALGPIAAVTYVGTSPGGYDTYRVGFAKGDCFFHVLVNATGEIEDLDVRID